MLEEIAQANLQEEQLNDQSSRLEIEEAALFEPILTSEGWIRFEKELENAEKLFVHEPESYAENNKLVDFDCGGRAALRTIKDFILKQKNTIKKYVEETNQN